MSAPRLNDLTNAADAATFSFAMEGASNYARWIIDEFEPHLGTSVVEVGIGHGGYFDALPKGVRYRGVDINAELIDRARSMRPSLDYSVGDVTDPAWAATMVPADSVLCVNVIEHLQDDGIAVRNSLSVLKPGGHLLVFVPAMPFLYNDLDRLAGHYRRYTKATLGAILTASGAKIRRLDFFNPIGAIGWWANRWMSHRSLETSNVRAQVQVFDKVVLPVSRALNAVTRGFFGQSLIAVAQRT